MYSGFTVAVLVVAAWEPSGAVGDSGSGPGLFDQIDIDDFFVDPDAYGYLPASRVVEVE